MSGDNLNCEHDLHFVRIVREEALKKDNKFIDLTISKWLCSKCGMPVLRRFADE